MFEYVKFNCHVMAKNDVNGKTPEKVFSDYLANRVNECDYIFDGVECVVMSVKYDMTKTCMITKILRKSDL
jgi:hypothetical protein